MAFRELTADFIREFDCYLRYYLQSAHNTVWEYMLPVLSLVELAIKKALIRDNSFQDYKINMQETDRGYILKEDVEKRMKCVASHQRIEHVKDRFIFGCFTGLTYADIKKLTRTNIHSFFNVHQWVISRRKKLDIASKVSLKEIPKHIIEKYQDATVNGRIFPVPTNVTCNNHVSKLIQIAEIITEQKVTFHKAR